MKTQSQKIYGMCKSNSNIGKFIAMQAFLKKNTRKIPNKQPNLPPKRIRERTDKT